MYGTIGSHKASNQSMVSSSEAVIKLCNTSGKSVQNVMVPTLSVHIFFSGYSFLCLLVRRYLIISSLLVS